MLLYPSLDAAVSARLFVPILFLLRAEGAELPPPPPPLALPAPALPPAADGGNSGDSSPVSPAPRRGGGGGGSSGSGGGSSYCGGNGGSSAGESPLAPAQAAAPSPQSVVVAQFWTDMPTSVCPRASRKRHASALKLRLDRAVMAVSNGTELETDALEA
jgi:hypothetical protein